jgi:DNA-directed RNA polymerase subunit F
MLATVKLLKPINYKHEIVAKALEIDPQTFEISKILFTTTNKNLHNNQEDAKTIFNMFQK